MAWEERLYTKEAFCEYYGENLGLAIERVSHEMRFPPPPVALAGFHFVPHKERGHTTVCNCHHFRGALAEHACMYV